MILVFCEIRDGKIKKSSLETLAEARRRAGELAVSTAAVFVGTGLDGLAAVLQTSGAAKIFLLENAVLEKYSSQGYALALEALIRETDPLAVFFPATAMGRDLAPRLAARLNVSLASDCTAVSAADGRLVFTRPVYAGKAVLTVSLRARPAIATLRPNVFPGEPDAGGAAEIIKKAAAVDPAAIKGQVVEILGESGAAVDVAEAGIVVAGGRAMKGPEGFTMLSELASVLPRAAVGASRAAVDSGWIGHPHQVGQTGKTVSPDVYFAFGISGAIQHLAGISSSKAIVAVNKDPEAPIFKIADYGIVGDLFQVVPALIDAIKKAGT